MKLGPSDIGMNFIEHGRSAEATVGTGNDVLASDDPGPTKKALRHQFRVLDQCDAMRYHTREENLPVWKLHVFENLVFVLMARISRLNRIGLCSHLEH